MGISGQATGDPREDFLFGDFYSSQGEHSRALPFYLSVLEVQPDNSNFNYCAALCYLEIVGQKDEALLYLEKAVLEIDENYLPGKYKKTGAPVYAWFLLGEAYHRSNQLLEASHSYHQYLEYIDDSDEKNLIEVRKKIVGLGISYEFQRDENIGLVFNLGELINSRFSDYNPVLSRDQKILIYTQFWESSDRIMYSTYSNRNWNEPVDINKQIESRGNAYTTSLSADGNTLYLVNTENDIYNIYFSERVDNSWTRMKPVPGKVNSKWRETSASVSEDGKYLYFSSDRKGGEGGVDLYRAEWTGSEWNDIRGLGDQINTQGNEEAPYVVQSDSLLYFSSDGHESIGNMDILSSRLTEEGEWSAPENIGAPVNTTEDDISYIYFPATRSGFLARDLEGGYGKNDIYMYQPAGFFPGARSSTIQASDAFVTEQEETGSDVEMDLSINNEVSTVPESRDVGPIIETEPSGMRLFTIQIMALTKKPLDSSYFKIPDLKVSKGNDGFYRYFTGEYNSFSEALSDLRRIRNFGFHDAFIQKMSIVK